MTGRGRRRKRARENDGREQYKYKLISFDTDDDVCDESEYNTGGEFV